MPTISSFGCLSSMTIHPSQKQRLRNLKLLTPSARLLGSLNISLEGCTKMQPVNENRATKQAIRGGQHILMEATVSSISTSRNGVREYPSA